MSGGEGRVLDLTQAGAIRRILRIFILVTGVFAAVHRDADRIAD